MRNTNRDIKELLSEVVERRQAVKNPVIYRNLTQEKVEHIQSLYDIENKLLIILDK